MSTTRPSWAPEAAALQEQRLGQLTNPPAGWIDTEKYVTRRYYGDQWLLHSLDPAVDYGIFIGNGNATLHKVSCGQRWGYPSLTLSATTVAALFNDTVLHQPPDSLDNVIEFCGSCVVKRAKR